MLQVSGWLFRFSNKSLLVLTSLLKMSCIFYLSGMSFATIWANRKLWQATRREEKHIYYNFLPCTSSLQYTGLQVWTWRCTGGWHPDLKKLQPSPSPPWYSCTLPCTQLRDTRGHLVSFLAYFFFQCFNIKDVNMVTLHIQTYNQQI